MTSIAAGPGARQIAAKIREHRARDVRPRVLLSAPCGIVELRTAVDDGECGIVEVLSERGGGNQRLESHPGTIPSRAVALRQPNPRRTRLTYARSDVVGRTRV